MGISLFSRIAMNSLVSTISGVPDVDVFEEVLYVATI